MDSRLARDFASEVLRLEFAKWKDDHGPRARAMGVRRREVVDAELRTWRRALRMALSSSEVQVPMEDVDAFLSSVSERQGGTWRYSPQRAA
jgi:hypothetical protein